MQTHWKIKNNNRKIRRTGRSKQINRVSDKLHQYSRFSLLGSGNWNDESYKSQVTSMLGKRERNTSHRTQKISTFRQLEKPVFSVGHQSKHAAEARTAIRDEVTSVKQQLEKPVFPVVHQTSMLQKQEQLSATKRPPLNGN